jgi:hypothetical protein
MGNNDGDNNYGNDDASYGGRGHYGHTSDFDTTLLSEDGRFFGIKLSPEMASQLDTFYNQFLDYTRRKAEQLVVPIATGIASKFTKNTATARRIGDFTGDVVGYSTILSKQLLNTGRNAYDSLWALNELRMAVAPLSKSSGSTAPLSGNNEVVANARSRISSVFWQSIMKDGVSILAVAPDLITKVYEQATINKLNRKSRELDQAKASGNEDEVIKVLRQQVSSGSVQHGAEPDLMEGALKKFLDEELHKYEANFQQYKEQHFKGLLTELQKTLGVLTPENISNNLKILERHGLDVSELRNELNYARGSDNAEYRQQLVDSFKRNATHPSIIEEALRSKYEKTHGDVDAYREKIIGQISGVNQKQHEHKEEETHLSQQGNYIAKMGGKLVAGIASKWVGDLFFGGKAAEKYQKPIALERILHLRRELEKASQDAPEQVPGIEMKHYHESDMSYTRFVHEIFQQHQRDCNRVEIGERFVSNFDNTRWNDEAIQNLSDDQLTAYEYAVKTIAQRIKSGRMDAIALIELVGDKQKKIVGDDGRSFGPRGSGKDDASAKEAIRKVIDEKTALLHASQKQTAAEINDKLGNFVFSVEDLKKALESDILDKDQRAFIFTVFSDVTGSDEKLCKKLAINKERCQALRNECKERFTTMLDGAVNVLADMIQNSPEALDKHMKLTEREKELIVSMAAQSREDNKHIADAVKSRDELNIIERSVANAAMTLGQQPGAREQEGFWQRVVSAVRAPLKSEKDVTASAQADNEMPSTGHVEREMKRQMNKDESPDLSIAP